MPSSPLARRLVVAVLLLFLGPTLGAGAILLVLYHRGVLADPAVLAAAAGLGFVALTAYLATVAHALGRTLVRTVHEIQLGTELMATVNPGHRLDVRTGDELAALAAEINRLADHLAVARTGLEAEVSRATRELDVERRTLAAILDASGEGVVVATPEGRVTLANRAARAMLGDGAGLLGRSLLDVIDREQARHHLDRLGPGEGRAERFAVHHAGPGGARTVEAVMTPFFDDRRQPLGVVLVLHDVTEPIDAAATVRRGLGEALPELRGRLASIRSLSESLLDAPALTAPEARPLLAGVHGDAVRLSGLVAGLTSPTGLGLDRAPWHFGDLTVTDLVALTVRRLDPDDPGRRLLVDGDLAGLPPLRAEAVALSAGMAHLVRTLAARAGPGGAVRLGPGRQGRFLQLTLTVEARQAAPAEVAGLERVLDAGGVAGVSGDRSVREVVRQHAGEAWACGGEDRLGFRVLVPLRGDGDRPPSGESGGDPGWRFAGAGLRSGAGGEVPGPERPDFYDLSLFEAMAGGIAPVDRARPLDQLTCVVLDAETTGLHPEAGDRIVSLAGVRIRAGQLRRGETFDALVNPGRRIPPPSTRLHGITDAMVTGAPPIDVVLPAFLRFAGDALLVGHEVWFDLRFLDADALRLGQPALSRRHAVLDTLRLSEAVHGRLPGHGLDAVAARLGVPVRGRHSALGDALTTAEVFVRLIELLRKRGVTTLGEAVEASRRSRAVRPDEAAGTASDQREGGP